MSEEVALLYWIELSSSHHKGLIKRYIGYAKSEQHSSWDLDWIERYLV